MATSAAEPPRTTRSPVGGPFGISAVPFVNESLPGFVMRVARSLRFRSADRLAAIAGLRQPGSAVSDTGLARLAERTGSRPAISSGSLTGRRSGSRTMRSWEARSTGS